MATLYQKLFPQQYITKFLLNDIRQDSRPLTQYRPISIKSDPLPQCNASAEVSIGQTKVLCGLFYELGLPSIFAQREGQVHININTAPLASNNIINKHSRERNEEGTILTHLLHDLIKKQKLFQLSNLYISDKTVWHAHIDITIMTHDGNAWDAIVMAFQHVVKLTEMKYQCNIPHLPLTKLLEREALYQKRQAEEKILKSTQENYKSVISTLPPPNNNHINVPKLELDLSKMKASSSGCNSGVSVNGVGIYQENTNPITSPNTLDNPAPYPTLLFPPIILRKTLYPTSIAVIPVQYIKPVPKEDDKDNNMGEDNDDEDKQSKKTGLESLTNFNEKEINSREAVNAVQQSIPFTTLAKQNRPYLLSRNVFVLDPTSSESAVADSIISIIFDQDGQICFTQKTSGVTISPSALFKCMEVAAQHSGRISKMIGKYFSTLELEISTKNKSSEEDHGVTEAPITKVTTSKTNQVENETTTDTTKNGKVNNKKKVKK